MEGGGYPLLINVFISHSSTDTQLAASLIDLLRVALPDLLPETIRCTSVPGYRLPGGSSTDDQLREEMHEARIFIGLITKESLTSTYVLFELGARWGAGLQLTPLMAGTMEPSVLKAPLDRLNAHSCNIESHVQQLLTEVSTRLEVKLAASAVYDRHLKQLVTLSQNEAELRKHWGKPLRVLPTAYDVYSAVPKVIQKVEAAEDSKRTILVGTLHGSSSKPPRNWRAKLSRDEAERFAEFDDVMLRCIRSSGAGRWHVKEFKNIVTRDRLKRATERISQATEGYEVRAACIPDLIPCLSPLVIGEQDLFLATTDTGVRRIGAGLHIHSREAVTFINGYFALLWDHPGVFRLRTEAGVNHDEIEALRLKVDR